MKFKSIKEITDEYKHQTFEEIEEQTKAFEHYLNDSNEKYIGD